LMGGGRHRPDVRTAYEAVSHWVGIGKPVMGGKIKQRKKMVLGRKASGGRLRVVTRGKRGEGRNDE